MNTLSKFLCASLALWPAALYGTGAAHAASKAAAASPVPNPFEEGAYLFNQAFDTDFTWQGGSGYGDWLKYKSWLGVSQLAAEADPGFGAGDWWDCSQHVSWNGAWGNMQQRYGTALPDVVLGTGQMPSDPNSSDSWNQKLAWENSEWQLEAANDPTTMAYFANYAQEVDNGSNNSGSVAAQPFKQVIIRMGYEFDGGWNPWGNLNVMSNMPANYIAAWQNIVTTMRANDPKHLIKFCWNPTDGNVQVNSFSYYPGDAYVDYIGLDEYDYDYSDYNGTSQPTQAQQTNAWNNVELPRINAFSSFASSSNTSRNGYVSGRTVPIVFGEWGLWQYNDSGQPGGGDNPSYIQHMHDWMANPANHVALEVYFEAPSNGISTLWGQGSNPALQGGTTYPNAAALYRTLFGPNGGAGGTTLAAPTWSSLTPGSGSVFLSWYWTSGATSYNIYRGTSPGQESATPIVTGDTSSSWNDIGLTNGTTYYYTLVAVNASGTSAQSAEASATAK